jgi:hypothetical protein
VQQYETEVALVEGAFAAVPTSAAAVWVEQVDGVETAEIERTSATGGPILE